MTNKFNQLDAELKERLIIFLAEGNTVEDLAEQLLEALPDSDLENVIRDEAQLRSEFPDDA